MKTFIIALLFVCLTNTVFSQDNKNNEAVSEILKTEELPGVVIKSAGKDFSVYLPDHNVDKNVRQLENKFVGYNLGKDYEGYDTFLVIMECEKGTLTASYNQNGKLINVVENYKDLKLPNEVIYAVYKGYPGWQITNDKYVYSQKEGDVTKKEYTLKLKKDKETLNIKMKPSGEIIN